MIEGKIKVPGHGEYECMNWEIEYKPSGTQVIHLTAVQRYNNETNKATVNKHKLLL